MLPAIVIAWFFVLFVCSYVITKVFIHPAVVVSLLWGVILFIYQTIDHGLFPLSERFFQMIFLWVSLFCLSSLSLHKVKISFPRWIWAPEPNPHLLRFLFPILILITIYQIYRLYTIGGGDSVRNIVLEHKLPVDLLILAYVNKFSLLLCLCVILFKTTLKKWENICLSLLLLVMFAQYSNKGSFCQLASSLFFALYYIKKLTFSRVFIGVGVLFLLIVGVQIFRENYIERNEKFDIPKFLALYTLSPLPACDMVLNHEVNYQKGETISFFNKVALKTGIKDPQRGGKEDKWVMVPIATNVYTAMFPFYNDYGPWGVCLFAILLGLFWSILYKGLQYDCAYFVLLYALLFYALPLQFFSDFIVQFLSVNIQFIIIAGLFFVRFRLKPSCPHGNNRHSLGNV